MTYFQPAKRGKGMEGVKQRIGNKGEALAAEWLAASGFEILHRNWRTGRYEVDIIAVRAGVLHFIEVKTKRSTRYGHPEQQVGRRKVRHLVEAGCRYISADRRWRRIRFDILAVQLYTDRPTEFLLIEDIYL
jgi:putative endonuclease